MEGKRVSGRKRGLSIGSQSEASESSEGQWEAGRRGGRRAGASLLTAPVEVYGILEMCFDGRLKCFEAPFEVNGGSSILFEVL